MHTLISADGALLAVTTQGGQICSWCAPDGRELLYTSPCADFSGATAIRGGIPVIFPQFGREGPLQRHGFARMRPWQLAGSWLDESGRGHLRMELQHPGDQDFGHACALELEACFGGQRLDVTLRVRNLDPLAFRFTAALHTYLRVPVAESSVHGLAGCRYLDAACGRTPGVAGSEPLRFDREIDRIYYAVPGPLLLSSGEHQLKLSQQGFVDVVAWNPGEALGSGIGDLPPDGWQRFVCLEAALIGAPRLLAPAQSWSGTQSLLSGNSEAAG